MSVLALVMATAGAGLTLVSAIGLLRLADPVTRLHAVTKASTLGTILVLTAVVIVLPGIDVGIKLMLTVLFQLATAPVSAHVIGRIAHRAGLLGELSVDDLRSVRWSDTDDPR